MFFLACILFLRLDYANALWRQVKADRGEAQSSNIEDMMQAEEPKIDEM